MKNKQMSQLVFIISTLSTGLIAGLMYAYSCSINPGLGRLNDLEYLRAMQSINRAILNPLFFMTFMGTLILLPVSTWLSYDSAHFWYFLAATIIYAIGVFGVTIGGNVPLNEALDKFNIGTASPDQLALQRSLFEQKWNMFHVIRTVANVSSALLAILGCMAGGK
jgi:uncharacterized membrane protein